MKFEDYFDDIIGHSLKLPTYGFREDLADRYRSSGRWYHNAGHIVSVVQRIIDLCPVWQPEEKKEALVAALYHDAVYVPGWDQNEIMSARLMEMHLEAMGAPDGLIANAYQAILSTQIHRPRNDSTTCKLLIDADLYELGTSRYEYNSRRIRQEFANVPEDQWIAGRKKFLYSYLIREPLFYISGQELIASVARENMENELALLIRGDGAIEVHGLNSAEG